MTHEQANRVNKAFGSFGGQGGGLVVDGVPQGNGTEAAAALSCLTTEAVEQLLSDMATQAMMLDCLMNNPNCYKPEDIPSADSKPTFYVTCSSQGHSHTYVKWN